MVYVFLAEGFEPIEAVTPVDMLHRAGIEAVTVAIGSSLLVDGAHGVSLMADVLFEDVVFSGTDMLVLPGGPGTSNYETHKGLCSLVRRCASSGIPIAAICAAPGFLGRLGVLEGRRATVYPGCDEGVTGVEYTGCFIEHDGNFITAVGPAASSAFAAEIIETLLGREARLAVCRPMFFREDGV